MAGADLLSCFSGLPIAVVGDVMLDHFIVGRVDRISPEAPVPVVRFARDDYRLGGAGNVAQNIVTLGSRASIVGLMGSSAAFAGPCAAAQPGHGSSGLGLLQDVSRTKRHTISVDIPICGYLAVRLVRPRAAPGLSGALGARTRAGGLELGQARLQRLLLRPRLLRHGLDHLELLAVHQVEVRQETFKPALDQRVDLAGLIGRADSASYVPKSGPEGERLLGMLRDLHARHADAGGIATIVYETEVWRTTRRP